MPITHRVARYVIESREGEPKSLSRPPPQLAVALDLLVHLPYFYNILADTVDDYEDDCDDDEEFEPDLIDEIKKVFDSAMTCGLETEINIRKVYEKLSELTGKNYFNNDLTPDHILKDLTEQMSKCLPNLLDIFCSKSEEAIVDMLGGETSSRQGLPISMALFHEDIISLEASFRDSFRRSVRSESSSNLGITPPPVLIVSVLSTLLGPPLAKNLPDQSHRNPSEINFPENLDLSACVDGHSPFRSGVTLKYDLVSVVSSNLDFSRLSLFFKKDLGTESSWHGGLVGSDIELIDKVKAISGNQYKQDENKVHPRILVYIRKDFPLYIEELRVLETVSSSSYCCNDLNSLRNKLLESSELSSSKDYVKSSAMRSYVKSEPFSSECAACSSDTCTICDAGDDIPELTNDDDSLSDSNDYDSDRPVSSPTSSSGLSAAVLEEQADLTLANRRLKDALEIYGRAISAASNSSSSSSETIRILQDKRDRVAKLIKLDTSTLLIEKGEKALSRNAYAEARAHYVKAAHNQSDISHLKIIIAEIDQCIKLQTSSQKIVEAHAAMRAGQYQAADELFRCAIALNPEKALTLESVQASLIPLIKTENAQNKQKLGAIALEEKRYQDALNHFTDAINILPEGSSYLPSYFCDRASVYCELKDFTNAISNCDAALALENDYGLAFFRLGTAYFGLDKLDDAYSNYEKALKVDPSLGEVVKVKIRQVNSAKEVQQRKEREAERVRQKEEEQKALQEKRAREEQIKKEKMEKAAIEKAEKMERARIKEEEKKLKAQQEKAEQALKEKEKEAEKQRLKEERAKKELERAQEREKTRLEKEKDRERLKKEKEKRALDLQKLAEEEKKRKEDFVQEMARVEKIKKEAEKEKEADRERARVEMEKVIADRERIRMEKINSGNNLDSISIAATSSSHNNSTCVKCSLAIDGSNRYAALGNCNHRVVCSTCTLRMRSSNLGDQDLTCYDCKINLDHIVCTMSSQAFNKFHLPGNPGPDLIYDKKSRIFFPKDYYKSSVDSFWKFTCKKCNNEQTELNLFTKHLNQSHRQSICELCYRNHRHFPSEVEVFTTEEFELHCKGDEDGYGGHPMCEFCNERFFDEKDFVQHMNDKHSSCHICFPNLKESINSILENEDSSQIKEITNLFFKDSADILAHHKSQHFVCLNFACKDRINVFKSEEELKAHTQSMHSWNIKNPPSSGSGSGNTNMMYTNPNLPPSNSQNMPPLPPPSQVAPPPYASAVKSQGIMSGISQAIASGVPTVNNAQSFLESSKLNSQGPSSLPQVPTSASSKPLNSGIMPWSAIASISPPPPPPGSSINRFESPALESANSFESSSSSLQFNDSEYPPTMTFNVRAAEFKPSFAVPSDLLSNTDNFASINSDSLLIKSSSYGRDLLDAGEINSNFSFLSSKNISVSDLDIGSNFPPFNNPSSIMMSRNSFGNDTSEPLGLSISSSSNDPFKLNSNSDDALDFDAVMRLPLNFDDLDPVMDPMKTSQMPFRSSSYPAFDEKSILGSTGSSGDISRLSSLPNTNDFFMNNQSSRDFSRIDPNYSEFPSKFGVPGSSSMNEFSRLATPPLASSSGTFLPNMNLQPHQQSNLDRFVPPGLTNQLSEGSLLGGGGGGFQSGFNNDIRLPESSNSSYSSFPLSSFPPKLDYSSAVNNSMGNRVPPFSNFASSGSHVIDIEQLHENVFQTASILVPYNMFMYRWTKDSNEVALKIRSDFVMAFIGHDGGGMDDVFRRTNCQVRIEQQIYRGNRETFVVFVRGPNGHPANLNFESALKMVVDRLKFILNNLTPQTSFGNSIPRMN